MTKLVVKDKVALGEYLILAATNPEERERLIANPNEMLEPYIVIPAGHTIVVGEETSTTTYVPLPTKADVAEALDDIENFEFCDEFDSANPAYIDPKTEPLKALRFRIAEYVMIKCKK